MRGKRGDRITRTIALVMLATVGVAQASGSVYYMPAGYFSSSDSARKADNDWGYQFTVGYSFNDRWNLELLTESAKYKLDDYSGLFKLSGASLQGGFNLDPDAPVSPVLLGGLGYLHTGLKGGHDDDVTARGGLGLQWLPQDSHFGVRADAVVRHTFDNKLTPDKSNYDDLIYSLGFLYRLGSTRAESNAARSATAPPVPYYAQPIVTPKAEVAKVDSGIGKDAGFRGHVSKGVMSANDLDGDGIANGNDKCPDTPPNAVVDDDGCIMYMLRI